MKPLPRVQVVIEGQHFACISHAYSAAKDKGFTGVQTTFAERLKRGATTWVELLAPISVAAAKRGIASGVTKRAHMAEEKASMATLCAELDARKAVLREVA